MVFKEKLMATTLDFNSVHKQYSNARSNFLKNKKLGDSDELIKKNEKRGVQLKLLECWAGELENGTDSNEKKAHHLVGMMYLVCRLIEKEYGDSWTSSKSTRAKGSDLYKELTNALKICTDDAPSYVSSTKDSFKEKTELDGQIKDSHPISKIPGFDKESKYKTRLQLLDLASDIIAEQEKKRDKITVENSLNPSYKKGSASRVAGLFKNSSNPFNPEGINNEGEKKTAATPPKF